MTWYPPAEHDTLLISSQAIGDTVHDLVATCRVVQSHDADRHVNELTGTEHMVIIVTLEDGSKWLTDVGFGGQVPRRPLQIDQLDLDPERDSRTYGVLQMPMASNLLFSQHMRCFCCLLISWVDLVNVKQLASLPELHSFAGYFPSCCETP